MKKLCDECKRILNEEELHTCICDSFFSKHTPTIVTKFGIRTLEPQLYLYCADCLRMKHRHIGDVFC